MSNKPLVYEQASHVYALYALTVLFFGMYGYVVSANLHGNYGLFYTPRYFLQAALAGALTAFLVYISASAVHSVSLYENSLVIRRMYGRRFTIKFTDIESTSYQRVKLRSVQWMEFRIYTLDTSFGWDENAFTCTGLIRSELAKISVNCSDGGYKVVLGTIPSYDGALLQYVLCGYTILVLLLFVLFY